MIDEEFVFEWEPRVSLLGDTTCTRANCDGLVFYGESLCTFHRLLLVKWAGIDQIKSRVFLDIHGA